MNTPALSLVRLLCVCPDSSLLSSRHAVLSLRYKTTSVAGVREMQGLSPPAGFDGVILCHALSASDSRLATVLAHQRWPRVKVITLLAGSIAPLAWADLGIRAANGPEFLLDALDALFREDAAGRPSPPVGRPAGSSGTTHATGAA